MKMYDPKLFDLRDFSGLIIMLNDDEKYWVYYNFLIWKIGNVADLCMHVWLVSWKNVYTIYPYLKSVVWCVILFMRHHPQLVGAQLYRLSPVDTHTVALKPVMGN